jgi:hypothetical protein
MDPLKVVAMSEEEDSQSLACSNLPLELLAIAQKEL